MHGNTAARQKDLSISTAPGRVAGRAGGHGAMRAVAHLPAACRACRAELQNGAERTQAGKWQGENFKVGAPAACDSVVLVGGRLQPNLAKYAHAHPVAGGRGRLEAHGSHPQLAGAASMLPCCHATCTERAHLRTCSPNRERHARRIRGSVARGSRLAISRWEARCELPNFRACEARGSRLNSYQPGGQESASAGGPDASAPTPSCLQAQACRRADVQMQRVQVVFERSPASPGSPGGFQIPRAAAACGMHMHGCTLAQSI